MSSDGTLEEMIGASRTALQAAKTASITTKRPENVCAGHDALYQLVQEVAGGLGTVLAVLGGLMSDKADAAQAVAVTSAAMGKQPTGGTLAWWAEIVQQNAKTLIWAVASVVIAAIAFDRLDKLVDAAQRVKMDTAAVMDYVPAPN